VKIFEFLKKKTGRSDIDTSANNLTANINNESVPQQNKLADHSNQIEQTPIPMNNNNKFDFSNESDSNVNPAVQEPPKIGELENQEIESSYEEQTASSHTQPANEPIVETQEPQSIEQTSEPVVQQTNNPTSNESFFKEVHESVKQEGLNEKVAESIIDKDLLNNMKSYHDEREEPVLNPSNNTVNNEIESKLEQLKTLESEWKEGRNQLKEFERSLLTKETEINLRLSELKSILKHIKTKEVLDVKPHESEHFKLEDGRVISNIRELVDSLKGFQGDVLYSKHVQGEKNDFANWVEHTFGQTELAAKLRETKTKEEMLKVLIELY